MPGWLQRQLAEAFRVKNTKRILLLNDC
ncbi:cortex morphogenetic protein CmpA [Aneurinibacillus aneurinilyticus]|nr:cortex morphogenetic protein CmpA [Aneurinibacillus aneurinilyticus]MED0725616.1 cortex morphogenetic protein CmpA [Aneurinibacillus aneurinilyticus]